MGTVEEELPDVFFGSGRVRAFAGVECVGGKAALAGKEVLRFAAKQSVSLRLLAMPYPAAEREVTAYAQVSRLSYRHVKPSGSEQWHPLASGSARQA